MIQFNEIYILSGKVYCNPDFVDSGDDSCQTYSDKNWCTSSGDYGDAWKDHWGTFSDFSKNGESATVCPQCGCGSKCV